MRLDDLNVEKELKALLKFARVERVVIQRAKETMDVHIVSERLISYDQMETIKQQLIKEYFAQSDYKIQIIERYELSDKYDLKNLLDAYYPSLAKSARSLGMIEYSILIDGKWQVEGNKLLLTLNDSAIARRYENNIKRFIETTLRERFAQDCECNIQYIRQERKYIPVYEEKIMQIKPKAENAEPKTEPKAEMTESNDASKAEKKRKNNNPPEVIFGRNFDGEETPIKEIQDEIGEVIIQGKILTIESRELRNEKTLAVFAITDFTDTIKCKIFLEKDETKEVLDQLKEGIFVRVKGMALFDKYDREVSISSVRGIRLCDDFTQKRNDHMQEKRVELHAHTFMSDMDGLVDVGALIKRAKSWGHKALAITDHGVVQAFTEAFHKIEKDDPFKIIYGCEIYLVDDAKKAVERDKGQALDHTIVVFDLETTGLSAVSDRIIEIGAVKIQAGEVIDRFSTFVDPLIPISYEIERLTNINDDMVKGAPTIDVALEEFLAFAQGCVLVGHNVGFDYSFIVKKAKEIGKGDIEFTTIDTVSLARVLLPDLTNHKLNTVAKALNVALEGHHRAVNDAEATAEIYIKLAKMMEEKGAVKIGDFNELGQLSAEAIKRMPTYHAILLAQNDIGRVNLYKLVSLSHLDYFYRRPRIPRSLLEECREGLILGSACESGELYQAILREESQDEISRIAEFYDYLEIQPLGNNAFMVDSDKLTTIKSLDDVKEINKKIVALGEQLKKPVVATCDVHFMDPEDEIYRRVLMAGKGFEDADRQPPLYFRTTEEMLKEFQYLGAEKAYEVVVTNTNLISDMIEKIEPVRPDKCPPVIENSDKDLREICYTKAHKLYGNPLPKPVEERLERELKSIIGNGFAVMYIIAQKLVWKSNADGYLVGSRGSVGSSLAATMAGITEVNPLPAHYYCDKCYYSDFDSAEVKAFGGKSGCDMPDKACPVCGAMLHKEGHDIPFETFLGFNGDKEPDIDLNFSGEYQPIAHAYTEEIFGKGQTFRAGTIGTLKDKTAYGYVLKYFEERNISKRRCEIERIAQGCVGVRRTTGQHPGGIIVLPHGEDIYSFTPIQHPANDTTTNIVTTHFDYHSIDHNLLKLDILGHDDPTMIKRLEELTGVNAMDIPLDDKKVMGLFTGVESLGLKPGDLKGADLGSLGIPEFGTDFVMQMLKDTKPKCFSDLVRISGLSHGTDVWLNNAQELIRQGKCDLSGAVCTRDDIMTYLISMGLDSNMAFKIMELVRKGKVAKSGFAPGQEEAMIEHGVPDWYIWSCRRIKYMFPKAHAVAYVTMAVRIAYFKVYYPIAYYTAYFAIRASAFDYELMAQGKDKLMEHMQDYKARSNELTQKEEEQYENMRLVEEMYARGLEFMPIDLYKAHASKFQIIDGKIMPALNSINGMGDKAAEALEEEAKKGEFLSRDDIKKRAKVSSTVVETMARLNLLKGIPESNQISLLDLMDN